MCLVEEGVQTVGVDSYLQVQAVLSGDAGSSSGDVGVGDGQEEFEVAVASWLGVERDIVSVRGAGGVHVCAVCVTVCILYVLHGMLLYELYEPHELYESYGQVLV